MSDENRYIIGIDPGTTDTAIVVCDTHAPRASGYEAGLLIKGKYFLENEKAIRKLDEIMSDVVHEDSGNAKVVIEDMVSYGMPVGREVFDTVKLMGRIYQAAKDWWATPSYIPRPEIKRLLTGSNRAKDANVRQAILDMYPRTGGGKTPQVGTKAQPGPIYGFKSHMYSALAVCLAWEIKAGRIYH